ncbi:diguanylate cyclase (GGDEF)-like protein [Eoetvoesiella caeni]|uniref:diguanylate cyclase n=2 Tax=Eoetvoesiella caeni TaxID=645616 RepID=A0A366H7U4_9BURK|nr:diguanylate cyclase (GGDEF)-like protein [Eoetvoesiella caeni]
MASMQKLDESQIIAQLKYCKRLPTLPAVALQLVELAEDSSAALDEFAKVIAFDPALVGKLMRTANSSFYGLRRKVSSLSEAIGFMGLNATISLSLSFSLRGLSCGQGDGDLDDTNYWSRSLLTALAARTIAIELRELQPEDFLLAGLMQDIGVLAMAAMLGNPYVTLYKNSPDHASLLEYEAARYGFDHVRAGEQLLKHWRLPAHIHESVWRSHAPADCAQDRRTEDCSDGIGRLSACVATAACIADAWIEGASADALNAAFRTAQSFLDINAEQYQNIIASMRDEMPAMEALFESELVDPAVLQSIGDSALELLTVRNLHLLQASAVADGHIQALEQRIATLEMQTQRDSLTGLYNRDYLERKLAQEFDLALHSQSPFSVVFIDIDLFKSFNDSFGHAVGDQVLATVAHRILTISRQTDTVARYGGEEFVVLLPHTDVDAARAIVEQMLKSVRETPYLIRGDARAHITFSAGIAALLPGRTAFSTPAALIDAADSALYKTKGAGRGHITVHDSGLA